MTAQHSESWLEDTRKRLDGWGEVLRSTSAPVGADACIAGYDDRTLLGAGAEIDSDEAMIIDRYLCLLRDENKRAYRALFLFYYHKDLGAKQCAEKLGIHVTNFHSLKKNGEVYIKALWDAGCLKKSA